MTTTATGSTGETSSSDSIQIHVRITTIRDKARCRETRWAINKEVNNRIFGADAAVECATRTHEAVT